MWILLKLRSRHCSWKPVISEANDLLSIKYLLSRLRQQHQNQWQVIHLKLHKGSVTAGCLWKSKISFLFRHIFQWEIQSGLVDFLALFWAHLWWCKLQLTIDTFKLKYGRSKVVFWLPFDFWHICQCIFACKTKAARNQTNFRIKCYWEIHITWNFFTIFALTES